VRLVFCAASSDRTNSLSSKPSRGMGQEIDAPFGSHLSPRRQSVWLTRTSSSSRATNRSRTGEEFDLL
jgi:hypothetical protein